MVNFLNQNYAMHPIFFLEESCVKLQIEVQSDPNSVISQEHLDTAIKFGIEKTDPSDTNKYVVAFIKKFLLQRVKIDQNLLDDYLSPEVVKQWQEVLSSLEERNRKLINIQSGSLVFTLFCPTRESRLELQDGNWRIEIQAKIVELLKHLGNQEQ